jgi:hypothetical protein
VASTDGTNQAAQAELEHWRFHAALLTVFLHEMEHLTFPERPEPEVRLRSNEFYRGALRQFAAQEFGVAFGI